MDVRASELADREAAQLEAAAQGGGAEPVLAEAAPPRPRAIPQAVAEGQVVDRWSPFAANDGRQVRVSATLEPVYELKGFTRIGFRMIRRVVVTRTHEELTPSAVSSLSPGDLLRVDLATIARGLDRLRRDGSGEAQLSLIIPLSYVSLASRRGRGELVQPLREAGRLVRCGVICEICDIEGVPSSALLAAVSLIRPFTLLVVGRLSAPSPAVLARVKSTGLRALSFECPPGLTDAEFTAWADQTVRSARSVAPSVMVYRVASARRAGELALLGASHVSLSPTGG